MRKTVIGAWLVLLLAVFGTVVASQGGPPHPPPPGPRDPGMGRPPVPPPGGGDMKKNSGPRVYQVPPSIKLKVYRFVDVHSHITEPGRDLDEIIAFMDANNIDRIILQGMNIRGKMTGVDTITRDAVERYPERFLALMYEFIPAEQEAVAYVLENMASGPFRGIGELFVNGHGTTYQGDSDILLAIYAAVGERGGVVSSHWTIGSNSKNEPGTDDKLSEIKNALDANPKTTFILCHAGAGPPPLKSNYQSMIEELLSSYPNLYIDIAGMHIDLYDSEGNLTDLGKIILDMIKKFPDRFMVGFDMLGTEYANVGKARNIVNLYRLYLGNLPDATAIKVASGNAEKVYGIKKE